MILSVATHIPFPYPKEGPHPRVGADPVSARKIPLSARTSVGFYRKEIIIIRIIFGNNISVDL